MFRLIMRALGLRVGRRRARRSAGQAKLPPINHKLLVETQRTVVRQSAQPLIENPRPKLVDDKADRPLPDFPPSGELVGRAYVIDGDTIAINRIKIRISGIDAPEIDRPWGQKSKWAMIGICKGQVVTARLNGERSHDRLVGTCYLPDGTDIGAEMVRRGAALDWELFSGGKYRHLEPEDARKRLLGFGARSH